MQRSNCPPNPEEFSGGRGSFDGIRLHENTMPKQPFWFFLTWISILWYAYLVFHVGWKGFHDIRRMIRDLESDRKG